MPLLAILRHEEGVRLDPDPLVALFSEMGERAAEQVICRAMESLAARLAMVQRHGDDGRPVQLAEEARRMAALAASVGLASVARVAGDVATAAEIRDHAAQAATIARLVRVGERSLSAIWDLRDMRL